MGNEDKKRRACVKESMTIPPGQPRKIRLMGTAILQDSRARRAASFPTLGWKEMKRRNVVTYGWMTLGKDKENRCK